MCFGLVSCAVGVDTGTDDTTGGYDAGHGTDGASNEAAGDSGSGPAETGTPFNEDAGAGEAAPPGDDGGVAESGGPPADGGTVADSAPPADTGTTGTCAGHGATGTLVTYDLSSQSGTEASVPATTSVTGVTGGALSRASTLTAVSGSGSINSSNWSTGPARIRRSTTRSR